MNTLLPIPLIESPPGSGNFAVNNAFLMPGLGLQFGLRYKYVEIDTLGASVSAVGFIAAGTIPVAFAVETLQETTQVTGGPSYQIPSFASDILNPGTVGAISSTENLSGGVGAIEIYSVATDVEIVAVDDVFTAGRVRLGQWYLGFS